MSLFVWYHIVSVSMKAAQLTDTSCLALICSSTNELTTKREAKRYSFLEIMFAQWQVAFSTQRTNAERGEKWILNGTVWRQKKMESLRKPQKWNEKWKEWHNFPWLRMIDVILRLSMTRKKAAPTRSLSSHFDVKWWPYRHHTASTLWTLRIQFPFLSLMRI